MAAVVAVVAVEAVAVVVMVVAVAVAMVELTVALVDTHLRGSSITAGFVKKVHAKKSAM
eukprot:gene10570-12505_t